MVSASHADKVIHAFMTSQHFHISVVYFGTQTRPDVPVVLANKKSFTEVQA